MAHTLIHRLHNPRNRTCGCAEDCWCKTTTLGRMFRWWFPAHWFGIHHRGSFGGGMTEDELREWKRQQAEGV